MVEFDNPEKLKFVVARVVDEYGYPLEIVVSKSPKKDKSAFKGDLNTDNNSIEVVDVMDTKD